MEEIKVGEYVRDCDGFIVKVNEIQDYKEDDDIWYQEKTLKGTWKSMVVKHSKNIIDLIEVGDVLKINDEKYEVIYDESYEKLGILEPNRKQLAIRHSALEFIFNQHKDISIVTKEQFANMQYRVED